MFEKTYREIEFRAGCDIETAVHKLLDCKEKGELACGSFNGHMLYSDKVTVNDAYMDIIGKTKAEWDKEGEECKQDYVSCVRWRKEHEERIPKLTKEWINKGHKILDKKYWDEWDECVQTQLVGIHHGTELGYCLDIIDSLNNNCSLVEAKGIIDSQDHSEKLYSLVKFMVKSFCDRGQKFSIYIDACNFINHCTISYIKAFLCKINKFKKV